MTGIPCNDKFAAKVPVLIELELLIPMKMILNVF